MNIFLGIDTSCYTTSVALADETQKIICNIKIPLEVAQGKKGLQQSQALFLHIRNLTKIFKENHFSSYGNIAGICVSDKPRPQEGSYMPVFLASTLAGAVAGSMAGAEVLYATHQEGHLAAALIGKRMPEHFLAAHVSGGTTELLDVVSKKDGIAIEIIGATKDIAAGQVIDRLAQKLKFPFPGGRHVEECARKSSNDLQFKCSTDGCDMNFSGVEAQAMKAVEREAAPDICRSALLSIAKTLEKTLLAAREKTSVKNCLLFGGVMSNLLIREHISSKIEEVQFANVEYSADNAAGLAVLAAQKKGGTK